MNSSRSERVPEHYEDAYGWCAYIIFDLEAERDRYREALHTIAADTLDYETAEAALAWRQKLAHEASR